MNKTEKAIKMNQARWGKLKKLEDCDWKEIQSYYDSGKTWRDVERNFKVTSNLLGKAVKSRLFLTRTAKETTRLFPKPRFRHTEESKRKLSEARKEFLLKNPDKHPWRNPNKFTSPPCEHLKSILKERGIQFVEEFQPLLDEGKFYSIDIAIPEKKIGIEVNGNQHYNRDGTLKDYYKERYRLITDSGWNLHEVHYSLVFNEDYVNKLVESISTSSNILDFNYSEYISNRISQKDGVKIKIIKERVKKFNPSKEELSKLIWELPYTKIAEKYGVSDVAVKKRVTSYSLECPPKGYWNRRSNGYSHEESLKPLPKESKSKLLPTNIVKEIKTKLASGSGIKDLSDEYGLGYGTVKAIKYGWTYKSV